MNILEFYAHIKYNSVNVNVKFIPTFWSVFCAACGTMMGDSRSVVRTLPRLPNVKIVDLFFNDGFDEKKLAES